MYYKEIDKAINSVSLNDYIKYNIKNRKFKKVYEKKKRGTGFSTAASSFSANNILQLDSNVKCNISNNIMDNNKKNI